MVKRKSRAEIRTADGSGGMSRVEDLRFEGGEWPVQLEVAGEEADRWLLRLGAECGKRGWQHSALKQIERAENSGTISVKAADGSDIVSVVFERHRNGPLKIRARPKSPASIELMEATQAAHRAGTLQQFYRRGLLHFDGLPWRGELWLGNSLRLGPPSEQDESALLGPRYIVVDSQVAGIDWSDALSHFDVLLRETAVFLTVVLRTLVTVPENGKRDWTWTPAADGTARCEVRQTGYVETKNPATMPRPMGRPIPLRSVSRPDWSIGGITAADSEQSPPEDIVALWQAFSRLTRERRQEFLQSGSLYQLALTLLPKFRTASFAFLVAACEALKPEGGEFRDHNAYDVVEALLGKDVADRLRSHPARAQDVRSVHFHRGEFRADEFLPRYFLTSFDDPTFDEGLRHLARVASNAIIEWLKRGGAVVPQPVRRRPSLKRRLREYAPVLIIVALVIGWMIGWLMSR